MKKLTPIIISSLALLFISSTGVYADNNHSIEQKKIREFISRKVGMPELNMEKVTSCSVKVLFNVDEHNSIKLKEVSGSNDFLNEYVANRLINAKLKNLKIRPGQAFEIDISFN